MQKYLRISKKSSTFAPAFREKLRGAIAQLVEQRTENPCVPGSIPGGTTEEKRSIWVFFFVPAGIRTGVLSRKGTSMARYLQYDKQNRAAKSAALFVYFDLLRMSLYSRHSQINKGDLAFFALK